MRYNVIKEGLQKTGQELSVGSLYVSDSGKPIPVLNGKLEEIVGKASQFQRNNTDAWISFDVEWLDSFFEFDRISLYARIDESRLVGEEDCKHLLITSAEIKALYVYPIPNFPEGASIVRT